MAGWTKADFDAAYSFRVERYLGGHPNTRKEVRLNYHEWVMRPIIANRWRRILTLLPISSSDAVVLVGTAFGWGVSELKEMTGCTAIGTDISEYIQAEKDNDDSIEVDAAISAVGLDRGTGRGLELHEAIRTPGPRAKELVLDEDMASKASRGRIASALGTNPTWIIVEDLIGLQMTDDEIVELAGYLDKWNAKKIWLYTSTPSRTPQDIAKLTGHMCISLRSFEVFR